jgi:hypothetical protein
MKEKGTLIIAGGWSEYVFEWRWNVRLIGEGFWGKVDGN